MDVVAIYEAVQSFGLPVVMMFFMYKNYDKLQKESREDSLRREQWLQKCMEEQTGVLDRLTTTVSTMNDRIERVEEKLKI